MQREPLASQPDEWMPNDVIKIIPFCLFYLSRYTRLLWENTDMYIIHTKAQRFLRNLQTKTGTACAIFPTSSSACIIFLIRAYYNREHS